jgi:hypothetical protein
MTETKTIFSINSPTPQWANWLFRSVFLLNKVVIAIVAGDPGIDPETKVRIGLYLSGLDTFFWGLSRMVGVKIQDDDEQKKTNS